MSQRIALIAEALDCNTTKARIVSEVIKDIPDSKLLDFFVFRMKYLEPYKSADVATKEALFDYQRIVAKSRMKQGERILESPETVRDHCMTYYRGRDITNGPASYYDFVVIGMNKDGELVNKYHLTDHGSFSRLNADDEAEVYRWLFENQHRIGDVNIVPERDVPLQLDRIESPDSVVNGEICREVASVMAGGKK